MFHTVMNVSVSYSHMGFRVFTVMAVSVLYCHGCKCFILSWLSVFHIVIWPSVYHTVIAFSVSYCHEC